MLSVNDYSKQYIDDCRAKVDAQVTAFATLAKATKRAAGANKNAVETALASFEPVYFNALVLVLDEFFLHRSRTIEGKDGNPMNEVRVLCNSMTQGDGSLVADKSIKLKPDTSVLGYAVGDPIRLSEKDFVALSDAFFRTVHDTFAS